ncbi:esterase family protein [Tsuneonella sp. YG55]|uniref:Esterase family protein n=1 Tax=Tsuneonella litorea TaxID=2976475 RepID=A0A9X2W1X9_9SPHN|nr:esterase family protein [Tsuneonella litorea]MCT2559049.1 esterase family protein [Tsuneonella litorea]
MLTIRRFCPAFLLLAAAGCAAASHSPIEPARTGHDAKMGTRLAANTVESRSFRSKLLNADVTYHVVLPAAMQRDPEARYPVIYWLHGSGGYPPGVLDMLAGGFYNAMSEGKMDPAIIVFPDGFENTLWANAADGSRPVENMLVKELVPHVDLTLPTRDNPGARAIEGASMGGYGAARLGMLYPDVFGTISMINPGPMQPVLDPQNTPLAGSARATATLNDVFGGDVEDFKRRSPWAIAQAFANRNCKQSRIRMILGKNDPITPTNLMFSRRLRELGIPHEVRLIAEAGHNPREMLKSLGEDHWAFFNMAPTEQADRDPSCG